MRRAILISLLLTVSMFPAVAAAADFLCPERAFDVTDVTLCTDPVNPFTCPELLDLQRQAPDQMIFRVVEVDEGPVLGVRLQMVAENVLDDGRFTLARTRLCARPAVPSTTPSSARRRSQPVDPPWTGIGGGDPGIRGAAFSLRGPDPGIRGPNPGISIR